MWRLQIALRQQIATTESSSPPGPQFHLAANVNADACAPGVEDFLEDRAGLPEPMGRP